MKLIEVKHKSTKTYATRDAAIAAVEKIMAPFHDLEWARVVISAAPDGRFHPVVILANAREQCYMREFADKGIMVVG